MFRLDYIGCLGIILISYVSLVLSEDRVIVFSLNPEESYRNSSVGNETIPESLLIQLKDIQNVSDLLRRFITFGNNDTSLLGASRRNRTLMSSSRRNGSASGRSALSDGFTASVAPAANCKTEEHIIELDKPENGATLYWPSCVRVQRCGGCCTSKMLACKPLSKSILNVTVLQMHYSYENPGKFENQGIRVFSLERHDRCACICKERPEDCDPNVHEYRGNECRCICKNIDQSISCIGPKKIWNNKHCFCKCRNIRMCSSGRHFNSLTCRCEILRRSQAMENLNTQNSSISSALQVSTTSPS